MTILELRYTFYLKIYLHKLHFHLSKDLFGDLYKHCLDIRSMVYIKSEARNDGVEISFSGRRR